MLALFLGLALHKALAIACVLVLCGFTTVDVGPVFPQGPVISSVLEVALLHAPPSQLSRGLDESARKRPWPQGVQKKTNTQDLKTSSI